jgi:hypothetical protein
MSDIAINLSSDALGLSFVPTDGSNSRKKRDSHLNPWKRNRFQKSWDSITSTVTAMQCESTMWIATPSWRSTVDDVNKKFRGNLSIRFPAQNLDNGTYPIRMQAGDGVRPFRLVSQDECIFTNFSSRPRVGMVHLENT